MNIERRAFGTEIRMAEHDGKQVIEGHAAVFDVWSNDLGGFKERILHGAFDGRMEDDVRALFNHDSNLILGRSVSKTLSLSIDKSGLYYRIAPPDTTYARDLAISMERGDINQSSFAFWVGEDRWYETESQEYRRDVSVVEQLFDVSPVTFPAYSEAGAAVSQRSMKLFTDFLERLQAEGTGDGQMPGSVDDMAVTNQVVRDSQRRRLALVRAQF